MCNLKTAQRNYDKAFAAYNKAYENLEKALLRKDETMGERDKAYAILMALRNIESKQDD